MLIAHIVVAVAVIILFSRPCRCAATVGSIGSIEQLQRNFIVEAKAFAYVPTSMGLNEGVYPFRTEVTNPGITKSIAFIR